MQTSKQGLELIGEFEGFRSKPYLDSAGVPTIGIGFTYYLDGTKVTMQDEPITYDESLEMLSELIKRYELAVNTMVRPLNQNQFDALVSFTYNLGSGNLKKSTLLKKINKNPCDPTIKNEFNKWVYAGGKVLNGLVKRREAESELFFK